MDTEPSKQEIEQKKPRKKLLVVIVSIIIILIAFFLAWFFLLKPHFSGNGIIKEEPARKKLDQQIYTVEEIANKIKINPDYFKDKEIKVKAMSINAVPGLGCSDYSIASDLSPEDYQLNIMPESMQDRPTINSVRIGEYGVYTGHFFDKYWIKECDEPEMFVVTGYEKVDVNLPSLNKKETVSNGYIIFEGNLLRHPYEIVLNGNDITVNGKVYESENYNYSSRNAMLESTFNYLVEYMQRGDLEIIFDKSNGGSLTRGIPNTGSWKPQEMVARADKVMNSDLSRQEKKDQLKTIFDISEYEEKYLDDMIDNWNK